MSRAPQRSLYHASGRNIVMLIPDLGTGNVAVGLLRAPCPSGARRFGRNARDGKLHLASPAAADYAQRGTVTRRSRQNGATPTELPTVPGPLETSSQAILTTFTFPAALSGEDVSLLGASCVHQLEATCAGSCFMRSAHACMVWQCLAACRSQASSTSAGRVVDQWTVQCACLNLTQVTHRV